MEEEEEAADIVSELSVLFLEEDEAFDCIRIITSKDGDHTVDIDTYEGSIDPLYEKDRSLSHLRVIFDKYLECPTLLDKSLEKMVLSLAACQLVDRGYKLQRHALSALYALCKVRGRKTVQRFLPHAAADLQPVWNALACVEHGSSVSQAAQPAETDAAPTWEARCTLWNWMNAFSFVPLDHSVFTHDEFLCEFIETGARVLEEAGPQREAAAACLASWYIRPDLEMTALAQFVDQAKKFLVQYRSMSNKQFSQQVQFRLMGVLQVLNTILKKSPAPRERLLDLFSPLERSILHLQNISTSSNNSVLMKLLVKWWVRIGVTYLPPRTAAWRYSRGRRCLIDPVMAAIDAAHAKDTIPQHLEDETGLFTVPPSVEQAMGILILALGHSSTIVRWSAAKGIGRLTDRLPAICAHDILDSLLEYFEDVGNDRYWHGACLALAELGRRGLILPGRVKDVVPYTVSAIHFDVHKGNTTVGAHVRDAACYMFWAFARAYDANVLRPYLSELTEAIVLASIFDREVNCRRAASAAFQEAVGRQGAMNIPNGIAILTAADFYSLGNRRNSYLSIAKKIASFEQLRRPIIRHLYSVKLFHWDVAIRELSAQSLYELTFVDASYIAETVLPFLIVQSTDPEKLNVRHGALRGVAECILALAADAMSDFKPPQTIFSDAVSLVTTIEKKRLYRGRGGEIMRSATCRLIECIARARIPLTISEQVRLLDTIDSCLPHPLDAIQKAACHGLEQLMIEYFQVSVNGPSTRLQARVVDKFVGLINTSDNPAVTRGYTMALGFLPAKLLAPKREVLDSVLRSLCSAARFDSLVGGEGDAETRRNALMAISRIMNTVHVSQEHHEPDASLANVSFRSICLDESIISSVYATFLLGLEDYETDRRGDVGSWSRMAAMNGLVDLLLLPVVQDLAVESKTQAIGALLKQLCEKLDAVRHCAGACLFKFLSATRNSGVRFYPELVRSFNIGVGYEGGPKWNETFWVFTRALQVASLNEPIYFNGVIEGVVASTGDLTQSVSKPASRALLEYTQHNRGSPILESLVECLIRLLAGPSRQMLPLLKTTNLLLTQHALDDLIFSSIGLTRRWLNSLDLLEKRIRRGDVKRLLALIEVSISFRHVLPANHEARSTATSLLCHMLSHPFPRVRGYASEQLYVSLLEEQSGFGERGSGDDRVLELLTQTPWTSESLEAMAVAKEVAIALGC